MRSAVLLICCMLLAGKAYSSEGTNTPITIIFSVPGGFYQHPVVVNLEASAATDIFYTLDGEQPNHQSLRYEGPIRIEHTQVIRAVAYRGADRTPVAAQTYFIGEPAGTIPTVAVSVAPADLFDPEDGLFMLGSQAKLGSSRLSGANFWLNKEVIANLEIFTPEGESCLNSPAGLRLFGGMSRLFPQKSIALVAREMYGKKKFKHPVFGKDGLNSFKFLILRNSGSDFGKSHLRDAFITQAVKTWNIDVQDYQPAHVYLNGEYWGIYNIREKINRHFIAGHHDVDKDSLDLLEHQMTRKAGSIRHYRDLLQFLEQKDMTLTANYAHVQQMMDIQSFMDHQIAQIFFDNRDAGGNIRYWRPQTQDGRWRWILYDTDWGMGLHDQHAYAFNSLEFHTRPDGEDWPNPPWSTFMLRKLLENPSFRQEFINRFSDYLNTDLHPDRLVHLLDSMYFQLQPEIPRHLERWKLSRQTWERHIQVMRTFAEERAPYMWTMLAEHFGADVPVGVYVQNTPGGIIRVNNHLKITATDFAGKYFRGNTLRLRAEPRLGYRFVHWEVEGTPVEDYEILLQLEQPQTVVKAIFEPYTHPYLDKLIINEISPNNKQTKDWVELHNYSGERIWLEGYWLRDAKEHVFRFPPGSYIDAHDYLVVCEKEDRFREAFPQAYNVIGGLNFGINKHRESLELFDVNRAVIDEVAYRMEPTDSIFTLSLLLPGLDNKDPENWQQRFSEGTPNAPNPYYLESRIRRSQTGWMQLGFALAILLLGGSWWFYQRIRSH